MSAKKDQRAREEPCFVSFLNEITHVRIIQLRKSIFQLFKDGVVSDEEGEAASEADEVLKGGEGDLQP